MVHVLFVTVGFLAISLTLGDALFGNRVANPLLCFFAIWTGDFALLWLDRYVGIFFFHVTPASERMFTLNFAAFGAGAILAALALGPYRRVRLFRGTCVPPLWACVRLLIAIYALGVMSKYAVLVSRFGPVGFLASSRDFITRGEFEYPAIVRLLTLPGYLLSLNLGIIAAWEGRWKPWSIFALVEAAAIINDMPAGFRGESMSFPLFCAASWALTTAVSGYAIKLRHVAAAALGGVGLAFALLSVHMATEWSRGTLATNAYLSGVEEPVVFNYIDLVGTIPAAAYYLDNPYEPPGAWYPPAYYSFRGLYAVANVFTAPLGYPIMPKDDMPSAATNPISGDTFTAVCYLTWVYADFGAWGAVLCNFVLGLIATLAVRLARDSTSLLHIEIAACVLAMLLASWRAFYPADPYFWITLVLVWAQAWYVNARLKEQYFRGARV